MIEVGCREKECQDGEKRNKARIKGMKRNKTITRGNRMGEIGDNREK